MPSAFAAGAQSIAIVLLINVMGIGLAHIGVLTKPLLKSCSRLTTTVLFPALIFAKMGGILTPSMLRDAWPLIPAATAFILIGFLFGRGVAGLLIPASHKQLRMVFVLACSFSNSNALPLVLVEALCKQDGFGADCFDKSATFIFIWGIVWNLVFWTVAFNALATEAARLHTTPQAASTTMSVLPSAHSAAVFPAISAEPASGRSFRSSCLAAVKGLVNPPLCAVVAGTLVAVVQPLQHALFRPGGSLRWVGSATEIVGQGATPIITIVIAGTLGHSLPRVMQQLRTCFTRPSQRPLKSLPLQDPTAPTGPAATITVTPSCLNGSAQAAASLPFADTEKQVCEDAQGREVLADCADSKPDSLADSPEPSVTPHTCDTPITNSALPSMGGGAPDPSAGTAVQDEAQHGSSDDIDASPSTLVWLVALRMVIIPAACMVLARVLISHVLPDGADKRLALVLMLECATPSANLLVVTSTHVGFTAGAGFLAASYVFQYVVGIFSMTAGASMAVTVVQ